jgi:phosphoribosylaminoimidazole-succinocarboxamide synthase
MNITFYNSGKVRDIYKITINPESYLLCFHQTSRLSCFDRQITQIDGRGTLLTSISSWWFLNTKHIIPNHYLYHEKDILIARPARVIPLEIVVRAYITGNTKTSLWTNYQNDNTYCGITFPPGLKKNQKLDHIVITPTTKGTTDDPISKTEIIEKNILSLDDYNYIEQKSLELFKYGQKIADKIGFILVDTKYEFGYDQNNQIILIDEIHTPDSSRYWFKETYQDRFNQSLEPHKIDKDAIRDYLKETIPDPYNDPIPNIPIEKKHQVLQSYYDFAKKLLNIDRNFEEWIQKNNIPSDISSITTCINTFINTYVEDN